MQDNKKPVIEINSASISNEKLELSAQLKCAFNPTIHSPKVTAVFECEGEIRYLPFLIKSYFPNEDLETCTIVLQYVYNIQDLFKYFVNGKEIKLTFNLQYGEDYFEQIQSMFNVESDLGDGIYNLSSTETGIAFKKKYKHVLNQIPNKRIIIFKKIVSDVYNTIVKIISLIFIPILIIDALMAKFSLTNYSKKISSVSGFRFFVDHIRLRLQAITNQSIGRKKLKGDLALIYSQIYSHYKVVPNRVTFLSNRRDDLTGNFEYIYNILKEDKSLEFQFLLDPTPFHRMKNKNIRKFAKLVATSSVVVIDDFYGYLSLVPKKEEVKLIQVWHACGAFKTFGFSRMGKPGGPKQTTMNHRDYDYAVVSSENISRYYAEGFGISPEKVIATGVPRTDIFFDDSTKQRIKEEFYQSYPQLKDKKIMLFAPTFRGKGKLSGSYPVKRFDLRTIYQRTNGEYAIIVKLHPFIKKKFEIPEEYKDYILDFSSKSELNDLLFVTDLLVSDYSSAIFEASLLDIPMIFYAYDLDKYISSRDFYCEYKSFLPGKITYDLKGLIDAVNEQDFEVEKIAPFRDKFFDIQDGKSSQRVADLITDIVKNNI